MLINILIVRCSCSTDDNPGNITVPVMAPLMPPPPMPAGPIPGVPVAKENQRWRRSAENAEEIAEMPDAQPLSSIPEAQVGRD